MEDSKATDTEIEMSAESPFDTPENQLYEAAGDGNLEEVKKLLSSGELSSCLQKTLIMAIGQSRKHIVERLDGCRFRRRSVRQHRIRAGIDWKYFQLARPRLYIHGHRQW